MPDISRRAFLSTSIAVGGGGLLPAAIARAAAIAPDVRTGTLQDVDHVVILMQENRGFDHYFGTLRGVRGFADRFPIPLAPVDPGAAPRNVWQQYDRTARGGARLVSPFHLDTRADFDLMRMEGTPHAWPDAQAAWDDGRMAHWPEAKHQRAMGHYRRADLPFQFALAEAFTLCDAYHCSVQTGTNTNRLFLWTGTNDPDGHHGGPAIGNSHDSFVEQGGAADPYRWQTVAEAMQAAGIDWRIYQDMANNFTDNPLVGFAAFRDAYHGLGDPALKERALTTYGLDRLRADAITGRLPQVSYIIATDTGCEHPNPSSPAQGAAYTAEVLDALTANPAVWARTALLVMFDENDGFFDHVPPPAPPSRASDGTLAGGSTVDLTGAYHLVPSVGDHELDLPAYRGRAYGLGARVPMYVVSPWSRGGWVNSQVFDHTSVIRFLEKRFGFHASGTSPWRREICGDLTSAFDFTKADVSLAKSPDTRQDARRARAVPHQVAPDAPPGATGAPWQESGVRRSRPLPYRLDVTVHRISTGMALTFAADGQGAVFHVYNRHALADAPRRYMVAAGHRLNGTWDFSRDGDYDLWILGPNGFHRHFVGHKDDQPLDVSWTIDASSVSLDVGRLPRAGMVTVTRLLPGGRSTSQPLVPGVTRWSTQATAGWHDITIIDRNSAYRRRIAGRYDQPNRESISDPFLPLS